MAAGNAQANPSEGRGRSARSPTEIPLRGWKDIAWRVWEENSRDNMSIIAAGCAFYALLALFPGITALVSLYGLVADPVTVEQQMAALQGVLPQAAFEIIQGQAHAVASTGSTALSWGAAIAIVLALYSASAAIRTLFTALNVAYEEEEERGFLRFYLVALVFTLGAVVFIVIGLTVIVAVPNVLKVLPLGPAGEWLIRAASWLLLLVCIALGLALLYRFGPSRAPARWQWLTPGSVVAAVLWLMASLLFSIYAANFGSYNETYGALAGAIILIMWLYISAFVVLLGAEINAELELQTERDTTTGPERPKGQRQAFTADHTAEDRRRREARAEQAAQKASEQAHGRNRRR